MPLKRQALVLLRKGELSAKLTEGEAQAIASARALPSVACSRTRHLPLTGEDEVLDG